MRGKRFRIISMTIVTLTMLLLVSGCAFIERKTEDSQDVSTTDSSESKTSESRTTDRQSEMSSIISQGDYVTPEQFGAQGDGRTDDTQAFMKCMQSSTKYVVLSQKYVITKPIETTQEKYFYADPSADETNAAIICNITHNVRALTFYADVVFENITLYSELIRKGTSPHGETYQRTSNIVLVEVWNKTGEFINCQFYNGLTAIRGRKTTQSTIIPQKIMVENCTFTECKIPIQGYSRITTVKNSTFINDGELYRKHDGAVAGSTQYNGDVYGGDHCVYIERFGCEKVTVTNSTVKTLNSESGVAFQIYGSPKPGDDIPTLKVDRCTLEANGVASASAAHVEIKNVTFHEQQDQQYIAWLESGSLTLRDSTFYHSYAFAYADTNVKPAAYNCQFQLMTSLTQSRCNFPYESHGCTYVNWGGNVRLNHTSFSDCTFTKSDEHVLGKLYVRNTDHYQVDFVNTTFKSGDTITNNQDAISTWENCTFEN